MLKKNSKRYDSKDCTEFLWVGNREGGGGILWFIEHANNPGHYEEIGELAAKAWQIKNGHEVHDLLKSVRDWRPGSENP
jgi:hypothetical protein